MQRLKTGKKEIHIARDREDQCATYAEWADEKAWKKTRWGKLFLAFDARFRIRRSTSIAVFCLVVSFLIFYQFRVPFDLDVGMPSAIDVTSPISFEMVDEVTTEEKRLKAAAAVSELYDYDPEVFGRVVASVDRAFRNMRALGREVGWPTSLLRREENLAPFFARKAFFEKDLSAKVPDDLYEWLIDHRFTPRIENALVRGLEIWYERKVAELSDRGRAGAVITARTLGRTAPGSEVRMETEEILDLRDPESFLLTDRRSLEKMTDADRTHLTRLARSLLQANLSLNKAETTARREKARSDVLPVNISIKKSQNIVPKGSVVQPFHMAIVREIESLQDERRQGPMAVALALLLATSIIVYSSFQRRYGLQKLRISRQDLTVMMILVVCQIFFTKLFLFILDAAFGAREIAWLSPDVFRALVPIATSSMLVGLLIGRGEVVWFFTAFTAVCLAVMEDYHFGFFMYTLLVGIAGARGVHNCKARSDLYRAGLRAGVVGAVVMTMMKLLSSADHHTATEFSLIAIAVAGFVGGLLSALIALMIVPLLESVFKYTTDVKLLELSNLNHPLLKEMLVKAPGTYHHSMMVGNMVEAAAEEIGANPLLAKVMSYYHDIGKMNHPSYFIENLRSGQKNPHEQLSPFMSKTLLVAHVKDGYEMGVNHKLGGAILDGILQHHGTTVISYFYHKADQARNPGDPEITPEDFRYPGPKPQFKEAALCMMADSIEAAARTLDDPTPSRLNSLVRNIIQKKFADGQLDECNLTMKEIAKIERAFSRILLAIYHQRVDYPQGVS